MGIFDAFKKKNKFDKIDRESLVEQICELDREYNLKKREIDRLTDEFSKTMAKAVKTTDVNEKRNLAQRMSILDKEKQALLVRQNYISKLQNQYNRLKLAMDDKEFFNSLNNKEIAKAMQNPVELEKYLDSVYASRTMIDDNLINADQAFDNAESGYVERDEINGIDEKTNEYMAMIERASMDGTFDNVKVSDSTSDDESVDSNDSLNDEIK